MSAAASSGAPPVAASAGQTSRRGGSDREHRSLPPNLPTAVNTLLAEQPHARTVLAHDLQAGPLHAYLFHGPEGTGKRECARWFAAEILALDATAPERVRRAALAGNHPDLVWVAPTGAHGMRVEDVDGPVVAAVSQTPLAGSRRVFVIERAEAMSADVANRLLKTLEEPPAYAHLILVSDQLGRVLETVVSRCRTVRFDPLPAGSIEARLRAEGVDPERARASARLALGSLARARRLASADGQELLELARKIVDAWLRGDVGAELQSELLARARGAGERAAERVKQKFEALIEGAGRGRRGLERELDELARREIRREQNATISLALLLCELVLRERLFSALPASAGAASEQGGAATAGASFPAAARSLVGVLDRIERARLALRLNPSQELLLEALSIECAADLARELGD